MRARAGRRGGGTLFRGWGRTHTCTSGRRGRGALLWGSASVPARLSDCEDIIPYATLMSYVITLMSYIASLMSYVTTLMSYVAIVEKKLPIFV